MLLSISFKTTYLLKHVLNIGSISMREVSKSENTSIRR